MLTRAGAADLGSNAIRFLIVEFRDDGGRSVLHQLRLPVRMGRDVFETGQLSAGTMDRVAAALRDFSRRLGRHQVGLSRAVGTSALRESENAGELIDRVQLESGIRLEVIDGAEEARLVSVAVRNSVDLGEKPWLLGDLGGGSLEVSLLDGEGLTETVSLPIGAVRMVEALGTDAPLEAFDRWLDEHSGALHEAPVFRHAHAGLIATGGGSEALANMAADLDAPAGRGANLSVAQLSELTRLIADTPVADRALRFSLPSDRADVILPAALVYRRVAALAGVSEILVPRVGVKEGIVLDLFQNNASTRS